MSTSLDVASFCHRIAIMDLVNRYYEAVWRDDLDTIVGLFAQEGSFSTSNAGPLDDDHPVGPLALRQFYKRGIELMTPRPLCHNHVIDLIDDTRARGVCHVELRSSVDLSWVGMAIYEDSYVLEDGAWKFASRTACIQRGTAQPA